jgi:hypothetical protein
MFYLEIRTFHKSCSRLDIGTSNEQIIETSLIEIVPISSYYDILHVQNTNIGIFALGINTNQIRCLY